MSSQILKYLVSHGTISGTRSDLLSKFERQKQSVSKRTLGMVVGDFLDGSEPNPGPDKLTEAHISFKFDADVQEDMRVQIEELVMERNNLIHHFFEDIETESVKSWVAASARLDSQEERLNKATDYLRDVAQSLNDGRKALADFMMTEEFKQQFRLN